MGTELWVQLSKLLKLRFLRFFSTSLGYTKQALTASARQTLYNV